MAITGGKIYAYTDGSSLGNPGPGGWAVVIVRPGQDQLEEHYGSEKGETTNNRMELRAVEEAMRILEADAAAAVIRSDSEYVVNGINKGWLQKWESSGWYSRESKAAIKNKDLWERILELAPERYSFEAIRGHSGIAENERADQLAKLAAGEVARKESRGKQGRLMGGMVDVGLKRSSLRRAVAAGEVSMRPATLKMISSGSIEKGDVLGMARVAAVLAAKRTSELLPLCHQIPLDFVKVDFEMRKDGIVIRAEAQAHWKTGVEMEALQAVSTAALTIYDMCKGVDGSMQLSGLRLLSKSGGQSKG